MRVKSTSLSKPSHPRLATSSTQAATNALLAQLGQPAPTLNPAGSSASKKLSSLQHHQWLGGERMVGRVVSSPWLIIATNPAGGLPTQGPHWAVDVWQQDYPVATLQRLYAQYGHVYITRPGCVLQFSPGSIHRMAEHHLARKPLKRGAAFIYECFVLSHLALVATGHTHLVLSPPTNQAAQPCIHAKLAKLSLTRMLDRRPRYMLVSGYNSVLRNTCSP